MKTTLHKVSRPTIYKTVQDLLSKNRETSAEFHALAARAWQNEGLNSLSHSALVYAAFEYRCTLERVAIELYAIMHHELPGVEDISRIQSFTSLLALIRELGGGNEKLLYRTMLFNKIVCESAPIEKPLAIVSPSRLHDLWSRLSAYCHRQVSPLETWDSPDWVRRGYDLLNEVDDYLVDILINHSFGAMADNGLAPEVRLAKQAFLREEIDEGTLRVRLKLMEPVLSSRRK
jgi:hypothetical protein